MMDKNEEEFLKRLQTMFKLEAKEHMAALSAGLVELEEKKDSDSSSSIVESIFREAHSLKGAARSVERYDIEAVCQEMESIFQALKKKKLILAANQFDILLKTVDYLNSIISSEKPSPSKDYKSYINLLKSILNSDSEKAQAATIKKPLVPKETHSKKEKIKSDDNKKTKVTSEKTEELAIETPSDDKTQVKLPDTSQVSKETIRINTSKLDLIYLQAEQLIQSKISIDQQISELNKLDSLLTKWNLDLGSTSQSLLTINDFKEIIDNNNVKVTDIKDNLNSIVKNVSIDSRILGKLIEEHMYGIKNLLMLPISSILEGFPKQVRDLSRSQNKEISLKISGDNIEVDKRILEELKDPLLHILRNCIDHGIVNPDKNKASKAKGTINMDFYSPEGRNLEITVSDTGSGINTAKVLSTAIKQGVISKEKSKYLSEEEIINLIFKSGISTSPIITDISGRGLGLAIVNEKVEKLGGNVTINSRPNEGTTFKISLPLTIATFRGVLVKSIDRLLFVPTHKIKNITRIKEEEIKSVENRKTIELNGEILPIVKLSDVLQLNSNKNINHILNSQQTDYLYILVIEHNLQKIAFIVEEVLDEHQIIVKKMGQQLVKVKNISGVSVLGTGQIVPVLNIPDIMISAVLSSHSSQAATTGADVKSTKKILVTEDSITSRTLIKQILESEGYEVDTAVDGLDGYIKAQSGDYDLFVSDVDMPRMNGFELTAKIRNNKKLSEHPVILVTSLGSKEDQEHGIDVGANAYIIKSSFDDSNLIETVKKLI